MPSFADATTLLERDAELTAIASALDAAAAGEEGRAVILEGETGTGKTALLEATVALAAQRGMTTLAARGMVLEQSFAFGLGRQLFERRLAEARPAERAELLAGPAAPLGSVLGGPAASEPPPPDVLFTLLRGLYWLAERLAEQAPLALVVDDLHWADEPSQRAVGYLASRIEDLPLALAISVRLGEPTPAADPRGLDSPAVATLRLGALSEPGTASLLEALLGEVSASFASAAHDATGGNPYLVRELAATIAAEGLAADDGATAQLAEFASEVAGTWALRRLARLGEPAAALARSLAVLERAPLALAAAHAELDERDAQLAAERLREAGIADRLAPLRFTHPLVRDALYRELGATGREAGHRRAADLLRAAPAAPEAIASHLLECEAVGEPWAQQTLREAARDASARGHPIEAVRLLRRALREPGASDDPGLLVELGSAEGAVADPAAIERLEGALRVATEPAQRLAARATLASAKGFGGDFEASFAETRSALSEIPPGTGGTLEAQALIGLMLGRAVPELVDRVRSALATERRGPSGEVTRAELARLAVTGLDSMLLGERGAAEEALLVVVDDARSGEPEQAGPFVPGGIAGLALAWLGRFDEATELAEREEARARRSGGALAIAAALETKLGVLWWRGAVGRALSAADAFLSWGDQTGAYTEPVTVPARVGAAHCHLELDRLEAATAMLTLSPGLDEHLRGLWGWAWLPYGRSLLAAARGEWREALDRALLCGERAVALQAPSPDWIPWRALAARAANELGQRERALELAGEELEWGRRIGSPRATGSGLLTLGVITSGQEGIELLTGSVAELDRARVELEQARARLELGMALRRARRPREARVPLAEAAEIATATGASLIAQRARSELEAAGGRPHRAPTTGLEALSPREREIAELAAAGRSNPEIAEALFVSRKTVEAHLRIVFRKLEIDSREALGPLFTRASGLGCVRSDAQPAQERPTRRRQPL